MTDDLNRMKEQATDLDQAKRQADAQALLRAQTAQRAAEERVLRWDKAMQRAFKGIMPRAVRRRYLDIAVERADDE